MSKKDSQPQVPELKPGTYSDGHPLDQVHYLECKIILKPDRFTSMKSYLDFAKLVRRVADESDVELSAGHLAGQKPQIRASLAPKRSRS